MQNHEHQHEADDSGSVITKSGTNVRANKGSHYYEYGENKLLSVF